MCLETLKEFEGKYSKAHFCESVQYHSVVTLFILTYILHEARIYTAKIKINVTSYSWSYSKEKVAFIATPRFFY